ncbi:MAG: MarP family serine protease [Propionibacteriales bacterium]|nr:MarP family serine protease [Propionibacteriales bacterium]
MNLLDLLLLLFALAYALSGYRQGFIVGACSTVGLLIGGAVGIWLVPMFLEGFSPSITVSLVALFGVLLAASLGQTVAAFGGARVRRQVTWHPARTVDAAGGALLSSVAALIVAWALGVAVTGAQIPSINEQLQSSKVLALVDRTLPGGANEVLGALDAIIDQGQFPDYLEPFVPEQIIPVDPPTRRVLRDPEVREAANSVVKVLGTAECGRGVEGSGFLYAPERVMTNAHVVAGVDEPDVVLGSSSYSAEVVLYDPDLDIAVLEVPGIGGTPLDFDRGAEPGDSAAVLGYPGNGPFHAEPARIRAQQRLRSPDIYDHGVVHREVFSLYADVRPGNSGGPLVSADGDVYGVIFAASISDSDTGYAVTAQQVTQNALRGRSATDPVDTGECT